MPSNQNEIDKEYTPEQLAQFDALLGQLEIFLADLPVVPADEKGDYVKPPDNAGDWMGNMETRAEQNLDKLSCQYEPARVRRDLKLDADLVPRELRLRRVLDHLVGARFLASSDAFAALLGARRQLRDAGVDDKLSEGLRRFFSRHHAADPVQPVVAGASGSP